ncbi:MAG TPA: hypothetical protein VED01_10630, partial [Burkholderiales bacterium]|nr:hypothetical protein [Burkholderiales bacterium]
MAQANDRTRDSLTLSSREVSDDSARSDASWLSPASEGPDAPANVTSGALYAAAAAALSDAHSSAEQPGEETSAAVASALAGELAAPLPSYTINQIADYLKEDFWDWFGGRNYRSFNMSASGTGANSGIIYYDYDGFTGTVGDVTNSNGLTAARKALVDDALDYIGELLNISFIHDSSPPSGGVDLYFMDEDSGAYANSSLHGS